MEGIVSEVNQAYNAIENGKEESIDYAVFAEEHIHGVIDLVSNKDVLEVLAKIESSIKDQIKDSQCKDDLFSILKGSDVKREDLIVNGEKVDELVEAIQKTMNDKEKFSYILQYGCHGNYQKETVKIAAAQLNLPYMIVHREDVITKFSKDCEPHVKAMFQKCHDFNSPIILYIENLDGIINSIHASPNESMKRRVVEKELCHQLSQLTGNDSIIVIMNCESPSGLKNELQALQGERIYYSLPNDEQRQIYLQNLLSLYNNELSAYCLQHILIHTSCCSIHQLQSLFIQSYYTTILCGYSHSSLEDFAIDSLPKSQQYPLLVQFCNDHLTHSIPSFPNITDSLILSFTDKLKPYFSVVDVSRLLDWCRPLNVSSTILKDLDNMILLLRERDNFIKKQDLANTASSEPVERRSGEKYEIPAIAISTQPEETKPEPSLTRTNSLSSAKFCRMMTAESLNTSSDQFRQDLEQRKKEEEERLRKNEKKNMEERERLRQEEARRQQEEEEKRKAEFEMMKRKEEERQRRLEEKFAAQEAERNRKIEEQRRKNEEAARKRREEAERREEERHQREQEELEKREAERQALVARRRQREEDERKRKEEQNRREAEEQNRRFQEERKRIYEASMGCSAEAYRASTARLDEKKSAEQLALERDQKKREEAIRKAREQAAERLKQEKEQKKMEKEVYERLAALRKEAPVNEEEKMKRVEEAKRVIMTGKEKLAELKRFHERVKAQVLEKRKREEEEKKKREEEEKKRREEEERKRKEEEERIAREKREEEERKKKQREEEAEKRRIELEKEKQERKKKKQAEARKMEERILEGELKLLDAREKLYSLKQLLKEVKNLS